jgi:hypothetical protein
MFFKVNTTFVILLAMFFLFIPSSGAEDNMEKQQSKKELCLIVDTPEDGFQLALTLARKGVTETQPDKEVLKKLRPAYAHDPNSLIAASQVVAIHFQTVAAANNYWRKE